VDTKLFAAGGDLPLTKRPLLMTGRIVSQKGFIDGIEAAKLAGDRLMIVGEEYLGKKASREYFEKDVQPTIDGKHVLWESVVKQEHLVGHYQTAKALLFPIQWEEPFGMVMIEAMACGTPVIAYDRGSVSEIVRDGETGFIIDSKHTNDGAKHAKRVISQTGVEGLVEAIKRIEEIDRDACRKHVEKHFGLDTMVRTYEKMYEKIVI
jgi:glycosyltransferase involved in cell wall biosynthesis